MDRRAQLVANQYHCSHEIVSLGFSLQQQARSGMWGSKVITVYHFSTHSPRITSSSLLVLSVYLRVGEWDRVEIPQKHLPAPTAHLFPSLSYYGGIPSPCSSLQHPCGIHFILSDSGLYTLHDGHGSISSVF